MERYSPLKSTRRPTGRHFDAWVQDERLRMERTMRARKLALDQRTAALNYTLGELNIFKVEVVKDKADK